MEDNTQSQHEIADVTSTPCEFTRSRGRPRLERPEGLPGLTRALTQRGWSLIKLAAESDVHPSTILRAMRGKDVSLDALRKLCAALGCSADDLIAGPAPSEAGGS